MIVQKIFSKFVLSSVLCGFILNSSVVFAFDRQSVLELTEGSQLSVRDFFSNGASASAAVAVYMFPIVIIKAAEVSVLGSGPALTPPLLLGWASVTSTVWAETEVDDSKIAFLIHELHISQETGSLTPALAQGYQYALRFMPQLSEQEALANLELNLTQLSDLN